ncbi:hypothetical protein PMAYCL1PPCAC_25322, partial [Pristionchus mayeri]
VAAACRRSLDETLKTVEKLTAASSSAAEMLLHSMNEVLRVAKGTNFAAPASHASIARLFRLLELEDAALSGDQDCLPLLFFTRSFAVVLEEGVRQLRNTDASQMASDEHVQLCRSGLESSLQSVDKLTSSPSCAALLLLQRMNGVLGAIVETNFDQAGSLGSIYALFELIGCMQQGMVAHCEDLPFLYFSRSFAVVFEKAVQQLQQTRRAEAFRGRDAEHTSMRGDEKDVQIHPMRSDKVRDFSPEAIEGRLYIYQVPRTARIGQLTALLSPFGPIVELTYPHHQSEPCGFALAKLQ